MQKTEKFQRLVDTSNGAAKVEITTAELRTFVEIAETFATIKDDLLDLTNDFLMLEQIKDAAFSYVEKRELVNNSFVVLPEMVAEVEASFTVLKSFYNQTNNDDETPRSKWPLIREEKKQDANS